jgi:aspartate/methionine/tyrosine aminotransferase
MMELNICEAKYSDISAIGAQVRQMQKESGEEYLYLNQGVNAVVPIDLTDIIPLIDFNSTEMQVYPPMKGRINLRRAIIKTYLQGAGDIDNLLITHGGMSGLDLVFQSLKMNKVWLPEFFWGSYAHILNLRHIEYGFYNNFDELLLENRVQPQDGVIICDPNNPLGNKYDDRTVIKLIQHLDDKGVVVMVDSPYRGVFFTNDSFYKPIAALPHVVIIESFSKSVGLSGQRIGFIHSANAELMQQLEIRLMYCSNGVNAFSQILIENLLTTEQGAKAIKKFRDQTTMAIRLNINYLQDRQLLVEEFYTDAPPKGIFVVVNRSFDELLQHRIASVGLEFFTRTQKERASQFARICVSVPHERFKEFFDRIEFVNDDLPRNT